MTLHHLVACVAMLLALTTSHTSQSSLQHTTGCSNNGCQQAITLLHMMMQPCHLIFHPLPIIFHDLAPPCWAAMLQALTTKSQLAAITAACNQQVEHDSCKTDTASLQDLQETLQHQLHMLKHITMTLTKTLCQLIDQLVHAHAIPTPAPKNLDDPTFTSPNPQT